MSTAVKASAGLRAESRTLNPLEALNEFGQSVWLDYIRRSLLTSGELQRLIDEDGLRGVTSNPAIFEKAIAGSTDYSDTVKELEQRRGLGAQALYEELAVPDIQDAAEGGHRHRRAGAVAEIGELGACDSHAVRLAVHLGRKAGQPVVRILVAARLLPRWEFPALSEL